MTNDQEPPTGKMGRAVAAMFVGGIIAVAGSLVRAWGQGTAEGAARVAEIVGGTYEGSGALTILVGSGIVALGVLVAVGGLVWKLIDMLSD